MQSSAFYGVLPCIGTCPTEGAYSTTKLCYLMDLHYIVVTLSAQVTSKVTYGHVIVWGSQFHMYGEYLAIFVKGR